MRTHAARMVVLLVATSLWPGLAAPAPNPEGQLVVEPSKVPVGLFFDGATLRVTARIPEGYEAAVRLSSGAERLEMKEKARVGGVLWMNVGDVVFEKAPALYQLLTTAPLDTLAPKALRDDWNLGYTAVVVPADELSAGMIPELVKLKERDDLYVEREGGLSLSRDGDSVLAEGQFVLPASVRPGDYTADLVGFRAGRPRHLGSVTVVVERVGTVRMIWSLAMEHGLFYGSTAVVVALVAGLLTGLLFQSKRHGAH